MLAWQRLPVHFAPAHVDESRLTDEAPMVYVRRLAAAKAQAILAEAGEGDVILGADTIVVLDGQVLGKPADAADARAMLSALRGRPHQVITVICLLDAASGKKMMDTAVSDVDMRAYSPEEIKVYISSDDPLDKAGAYAIQHQGFHPVQRFVGCMASVMGMPLCHLERGLRQLPAYAPQPMDRLCQNHLEYKCPIAARVLAGESIG